MDFWITSKRETLEALLGEVDALVINEGEARMLGRDVEFLRFPQGSHDLSRSGQPAQRVFRFEAIKDWFGRYLV